jgi:lipopolysaccharide export system protein LptA
MSKRFLIISIFLILVPVLNAFPEETKSRLKGGPITVTSESLTSDGKARTALFEKNVIAKTTDMTIYASQMLVFYKEGSGDVTRIEATGDVKLLKDSRIITSQKAIYYAEGEEKVVFTGDPRAVDGENTVTGSIMTYFLKDDRSFVENSKVYLKNKKDR